MIFKNRFLFWAVIPLFALAILTKPIEATSTQHRTQASSKNILSKAQDLLSRDFIKAQEALKWFEEQSNPNTAAHLITALRFSSIPKFEFYKSLRKITGQETDTWFDWMLWQEKNPQIKPDESIIAFKASIFDSIDPQFRRFFDEDTDFSIRPEEIVWGGVRVDGIPALDNPKFISVGEAEYIRGDDLVFGVEINDDKRAYPLRIMDWHEMFNDVIGGVPVSLAYCTLCGSGILFDGRVESRKEPFTFGSSGFLYRSNKLMYDRNTDSLWNQWTGRPVAGKLKDSGIQLKILPVAITSWEEWKTKHPDTTVLSLDTGFRRNYGSGVAYAEYWASSELMFPALGDTQRKHLQKDYVYAMRLRGGAKAFPLKYFKGGKVINDQVGFTNVVLIGDEATRTVRAYDREDLKITNLTDWVITEDALISKDGETALTRLPGHVSFWFAFAGYLGESGEVYAP